MALPQSAYSQNVTLPHIPELFNPNFLDVLVPAQDVSAVEPDTEPRHSHPMMDALMTTLNRVRTTNWDPAYASTGSATLDAFNILKPYAYEELGPYLEKAWKEDPNLTLRLIWNARSIHDGKSENELFYRLVSALCQS